MPVSRFSDSSRDWYFLWNRESVVGGLCSGSLSFELISALQTPTVGVTEKQLLKPDALPVIDAPPWSPTLQIVFFEEGILYRRWSPRGMGYVAHELTLNPRNVAGRVEHNPSSIRVRCGCDSSLQSRSESNTQAPR